MKTTLKDSIYLAFVLIGACDGGSGGGAEREDTSVACQDGVDNDGDGFMDCDDQDCFDFVFCQVVTCESDPCDGNATCDDTGGTVTCTCNGGWEGDGETCANVDECVAGDDDCEQVCSDTPGSYVCSCDPGYTLDVDEHSCDDIDECAGGTDDCDQTCTDTDGSYVCGCDPGYTLDVDGHTCNDVDTCAEGTHDCEQICSEAAGSYVCSCNPGYVLDHDGHSCDNVDECADGTDRCDQSCADTDGSYDCSCGAGYVLGTDGRSCDIRDCGTLTAPANGSVALPAGTTYGAAATYDCDRGFYMGGDAIRTCDATGAWTGVAPTCAVCDLASMDDCLCEGAPDLVYCEGNTAVTCNISAELLDVQDCGGEFCSSGLGCRACLAGQSRCFGNEVQECDFGWLDSSWETTSVCDAYNGRKCDAATVACVVMSDIGSNVPTATMYEYGIFSTTSSPFLGGYDAASYGDYIYVNRNGQYMDVYQIALQDTDGDGAMEPDQHPDNPYGAGPMEQRVLTYVATYARAADSVPLGAASVGEMYAEADRIYMLGPNSNGDISEWIFATRTSSVVADSLLSFSLETLGYGSVDGLWYASRSCSGGIGGSGCPRRVYSFHPPTQAWVAEFQWAVLLTSTHADGIEVILDPDTGEQYVYVSEMTPGLLGQFRRDGTGGWIQENLFEYEDTTGSVVEGLGFGALEHFWVASGTHLYELGGGDLTEYLE